MPSGDHWADLKKLCAEWSDGAVFATHRGVMADVATTFVYDLATASTVADV